MSLEILRTTTAHLEPNELEQLRDQASMRGDDTREQLTTTTHQAAPASAGSWKQFDPTRASATSGRTEL